MRFTDIIWHLKQGLTRIIQPATTIQDTDLRRKAQFLAALILSLIFVNIVSAVIEIFTAPSIHNVRLLLLLWPVVPAIGLYWLNRQGQVQTAIRLTLAVFTLSVFLNYLFFGPPFDTVPLYRLIILIIISSLFISIRDLLIYGVTLIITSVVVYATHADSIQQISGPLTQITFVLLVVVAITLMTMWHRSEMESERQRHLEESTNRYRQIFRATFDVILVHQNNILLEVNTGFTDVFGYTPEECLNHRLDILFPDGYAPRLGSIQTLEAMRKNNTRFFAEAITIEQHTGQHVLVTALRNISRTRQAEQALRESELRFRMVTESSPDFIYIWHAQSSRLPYFNRDGFLGYTRDELMIPGYLTSHVHPEDWSDLQSHWHSVLNDSQPEEDQFIEYRIRHKRGHWEWVERREKILERGSNGKADQILITLRLISERKRSEEEIHFQASIFRNVSDAIVVTDKQGNIQSWNPAAEQIYGWSADEVLQRNFAALVTPPNTRQCDAGLGCHDDNETHWQADSMHQRKDKSLLDALISATVTRTATGTVSNCVYIIHDNTQRKQAEIELRRQEVHRQALIDAIPDLILQMDRDGNYLEAWPPKVANTNNHHLVKANLTGRNIMDVLPHNVAQDILQRIRQAMDTQQMQHHEYQIIRDECTKSYEARWVAYSSDEVFGLVRDITERKNDEALLRHQASIFSHAAEAIILTEYNAGEYTIQSWNHAAERMYGWSAEEVLGKKYFDIVQSNTPQEFFRREISTTLLNTGYWSGETTHHDKNGKPLNVMVSVSLRHDEGHDGAPRGAIIIILDITRRQQAEAALHMSEERFRIALKGSPVVVSNQDATLHYTWIHNPAHNFDPNTVINHTDYEIIEDQDTAEQLTQIKKHVIETGRGVRREVKIMQQGQDYYYDLTIEPLKDQAGAVVGITCAQIDITERVQAESARMKIQQLLQTVVSNVPLVVWSMNADGIVTLSEGMGLRAIGLEPGDNVGKIAAEIYPTESEILTLVAQALQGKAVNGTYDFNGIPMESHLQPIINAQGQVEGVVGVTLNINERKRMEQQELELALERERILMLRRFMGDVSHDFKTPLSSIKLSAYMLGRVEDAEDQARHLEVIELQTVRLEKLMADLFTMSRLDMSETQEFSFGRVDINKLLQNVIVAHEPVIQQRQHTIIFQPNATLSAVWADRFQLDRVFTNLLINAAHYTPNNGRIVIRTEEQNSEILIHVTDNGVGIAEESQPLIFNRFYRADVARNPNLGGTGVGLSIARKIIENHGGQITVQSTLGEGSTFTVILPCLNKGEHL